MPQASNQITAKYRFGRWLLDPSRRLLLDEGVPVDLQDQTFDLLLFLVQHPGEILGKDALLEGAWGHLHLSDSAIAQAVRRVRMVLDDDGRRQAVIRTVHGRGVQFLPDVDIELPVAAEEARPNYRTRLVPLVLVAALALITSVAVINSRLGGSPPPVDGAWRFLIEQPRVAESLRSEWQWLATGLPPSVDQLLRDDEFIESLQADQLPELSALDPAERARLATADYYLSTTLSEEDGRLVIDWALYQTDQDSPVRGGELSGPDPGPLLRQLVDQIRSTRENSRFPVRFAHADLLNDPLALELYARAMQAIAHEQRDEAAKLLEAARTRQPDSAVLQVALAKALFDPAEQSGEALDVYHQLLDKIPAAKPSARAWLAHELGTELWFFGNTAAAEIFLNEALALTDDLAEPLLQGRILNSLAFVQQSRNQYDAAWETALTAEQMLRELDSPYFLSMALTNLGYLAEDFGRLLQARDFHQEALELRLQIGVDELIAASEYGLARIERRMGLLNSAATRLLANLERSGIDNRPFDRFDNLEELAEIRLRQGQFEAAAERLDQAEAIARDNDDEIGLAWSEEVRGRLAVASGQVRPDLPARLDNAVQRFVQLGDEQEAFTARLTRIQVLQALGQTRDSGQALAALGNHAALANPVHRIRYQMILARQAELAGRQDQCEELLADALQRARQLGSVDQESLAAIELARHAHDRGDSAETERLLRIAQRWAPEHFGTRSLTDLLQLADQSAR